MSGPVEILLAATVTECGDMLRGELRGADRGQLIVRLAYRTASAAPVDAGGPSVPVDLRSGAAFFSLRVPSAGPISIVGRSFAVAWEVEVVEPADADTVVASVPVTVLPAGGTGLWARRAGAPMP